MNMNKLFVINTPILTDWGKYDFRGIFLSEVKKMLANADFMSAIGHEGTATLMTKLIGIYIPVNRIQIKMDPGDEAIVFRVLVRLPEGKVLSEEEISKISFSFGILKRVE